MFGDLARYLLNGNPDARMSPVSLCYLGFHTLHLRGKLSGEIYQFSIHAPVQKVDPRDAGTLLRTRLFRRHQ